MRLDFSFLVPGMPFDAFTLTEGKSLGGSESAALGLGNALARRGHNVVMFTNAETPRSDPETRLQFAPISQWDAFVHTHPHNIAVAQRLPAAFVTKTAADMNILWCHDLPQIEARRDIHGVLWNVDHLAMVSDFHQSEFERVYGLKPDHKNADDPFIVMRNAVDMPDLQGVTAYRDPDLLLYTSRPERGLDIVLGEIMPRVLKERPKSVLKICTYDNPTDRTSAIVERCRELAKPLGDAVEFIGPQSKDDLYALMTSAGCLVYPCPSPEMPDFAEVSCITFMEAMHCGLPVATTRWGASPETLKGYSGAKLSKVGDWSSLAANVLALQSRVEKGDLFSGGALRSWDDAAGEWEATIEARYAERNKDAKRLFHHWYRRSEIDGCRRLVETGEVGADEARLLEPFDFALSESAMAEHYRKAGVETLEHLKAHKAQFTKESLAHKPDEPRFYQLLEQLKSERDRRVKETGNEEYRLQVLDWGCGHGWFAAFACQHIEQMDYVGVDLDPGALEWANHLAEVVGIAERATFAAGDQAGGGFDVAICSEVLEHVIDPVETATEVESRVGLGGLLIYTVPFGPIEWGSANWGRFKNHIREFTRQDLSEMFADKPDTALEVMRQGESQFTGDGWGHSLITHRADPSVPYGQIDWDRKRKWTMPRETLSVSIIAGPNVEQTLGWCLESVKWIADEIVIGDTGMSDEAKAIAAKYGARLVPAPSPLKDGFAAARNASLDACKMDWVLWIDTDERLTDPEQLVKYLRKSIYRGWSVHQHHFGIDVEGHVDRPVRVFRRTTKPVTRFYGVVHEHPEMEYNEGPGRVGQPQDIHIMHVGYEDEETRMRRFHRNLPLLERDVQENPDRMLQAQLICRDSMLMAREFIRGAGGITPEAYFYANQCVSTFRARYLGQDWKLADVSPVPYYSQAARLLGGDIHARVIVDVNRRGEGTALPSPDEDPSVLCFCDMDDLKAYIGKKVKAATEPLEGEAWHGLGAAQ